MGIERRVFVYVDGEEVTGTIEKAINNQYIVKLLDGSKVIIDVDKVKEISE